MNTKVDMLKRIDDILGILSTLDEHLLKLQEENGKNSAHSENLVGRFKDEPNPNALIRSAIENVAHCEAYLNDCIAKLKSCYENLE